MVQLSPRMDAKLAAKVYQINLKHRSTSTCQHQPDYGESCIVLESELTHSLVAKPLQRSLLAIHKFCAAGKECCEQRHRRVCVKL